MAGTRTIIGSGNWNDPTIWDKVIATDDDVVLTGAYNVTLVANTTCKSLTCNTGYTGTFAHAGQIFYCNGGNLVFVSTMGYTNNGGGYLEMIGNGAGRLFASGGNQITTLLFLPTSGDITFQDDTRAIAFQITVSGGAGIYANSKTLKINTYSCLSTGTGFFDLTNSILNIYVTGFSKGNVNCAYILMGSTIALSTGGAASFNGGGLTYNIVLNSGTNGYSNITFGTTDTITTLTITGNKTCTIYAGMTVTTINNTDCNMTIPSCTIGAINHTASAYHVQYTITGNVTGGTGGRITNGIIGTAIYRPIVKSNTLGTAWRFPLTVGTGACFDCDDFDIYSSLDIDFSNIPGGIGICNNVINSLAGVFTVTTGIPMYPKLTANKNVSDVTIWYTDSGETTTRTINGIQVRPLPQDDILGINGSFSTNNQILTIDVPRFGRNVDFSTMTNRTGCQIFSTAQISSIYGSLNTTTLATIYAPTYELYFEGRGTHIISIGNILGYSSRYSINSFGGNYSLGSNLTYIIFLTLYCGIFNANNYNITFADNSAAGYFLSNGNLLRTLNMGNGIWQTGTIQTGSYVFQISGSNYNLNSQGSIINIPSSYATAKTFAGGNCTYNIVNFSYSAGTVNITGNNTFNQLNMTGASKILTFAAGSTQTFTNPPVITGTQANIYTITSSSAGSAANWTMSTGNTFVGDFINFQDISCAVTGALYYAGHNSRNVSGNSGIIFYSTIVHAYNFK